MWAAVRGQALGVKFRRQWVIGPFIADLLCLERRLIVEIDGSVHDTQMERDRERQAYLESLGHRVFRVTASEVEGDIEAVLLRLRSALDRPSQPPTIE